MIDVLVVGGGPAGLAAAIRAASAGLEAVVVEPRTTPVDKACGEGIMPGGVAALRDLGVRVSGHDLSGIRYTDGRRSAEAAFRGGPGAGVRRTELHTALHARAAALGVRVVAAKAGRSARTRTPSPPPDSPRAGSSPPTASTRRCAAPWASTGPSPGPDATVCAATTRSPRGRTTSRCTGRATARRT